MSQKFRIVDLFAGPGGLGEGFSAFRTGRRSRPFHIALSVEKEASAHKTLELRAFIRQFSSPPDAYYDYLRGEISREELFDRYPKKAEVARTETLGGPKELGPESGDDDLIYKRLAELKRQHKESWVVIGGPPCQAYSLVGRARNQGVKGYKADQDRRHFLYEEYLKVLADIRPEVFVMENVKGILSSKVNGDRIFPKLLDDLRCPDVALGRLVGKKAHYRIYSLTSGAELTSSGKDGIIRSEEYGVPQSRHRVILLGVREDIDRVPGTLNKREPHTTVGQMLAELPQLRSGLSKENDSSAAWAKAIKLQAGEVARELKGRGLKPSIAKDAAKNMLDRGGLFVGSRKKYKGPEHLSDWLPDKAIGGFVNHETRGHMTSDLGRYLYCSSYAQQKEGLSPRSYGFPETFAPNHKSWKTGKFADRFRVQAKNKPSSTITSHISKDGHYFIHYDPAQCRSLTVREAARLQTFPDNYFFEGNRTQQYVQVGNAVPPWLAHQIAEVVYKLIK